MKYVIFSFELGDYICNGENKVLVFDTLGLAFQYLQKHYRKPLPEQRKKRLIHYPDVYQAPFRLLKVVRKGKGRCQSYSKLFEAIT